MVAQQVPGQRAHARLVVAVHVTVVGVADVGQRHDRHSPGELSSCVWSQHPVVQDQSVTLAGQGEQPRPDVVIIDVDRAEQQVEAPPLRRELDAAVDHVGELQALVLLGEAALAGRAPTGPAG